MKLKSEIQAITIDFPIYGYRRITIEMHRRGFEVNHKVVYELMKIDNLLCIKKHMGGRYYIYTPGAGIHISRGHN